MIRQRKPFTRECDEHRTELIGARRCETWLKALGVEEQIRSSRNCDTARIRVSPFVANVQVADPPKAISEMPFLAKTKPPD